jgi:Protein of unknown function (DUF3309)
MPVVSGRSGELSRGRGSFSITRYPRGVVSVSTILIVILILLLVGALPTWPYSSGWGYYPSGGLGLVLVILVVLLLLGRI